MTRPSGIRFSVTGDILSVKHPRSTWLKYFDKLLPETPLLPLKLSNQTLSAIGLEPRKKVKKRYRCSEWC